MGQWGVKSYENDTAADALDAGFAGVHRELYEEMMDDRNPLTFEQVQARLADPRTLDASIAALVDSLGEQDLEAWDELGRLALVGIVVRHAELGVSIAGSWRRRALDWLEHEESDWEEATARRLRREKEMALLRKAPGIDGTDEAPAARKTL
jgi:hypothetical protein